MSRVKFDVSDCASDIKFVGICGTHNKLLRVKVWIGHFKEDEYEDITDKSEPSLIIRFSTVDKSC